MERIEKTVEVACPLRTVYNQWTRFEDYPEFVWSVTEVRQVDDTHVHCLTDFGGRKQEVDAEIIEQVPNEAIAWKSLSGTPSVGVVHFESLGPKLTRVRLMMAYEPRGDALKTLETVNTSVQNTIEDFKRFIEARAGQR